MDILRRDLIYTHVDKLHLWILKKRKKIGYVAENSLFLEKKAKGKVISHVLQRINKA